MSIVRARDEFHKIFQTKVSLPSMSHHKKQLHKKLLGTLWLRCDSRTHLSRDDCYSSVTCLVTWEPAATETESVLTTNNSNMVIRSFELLPTLDL